MAFQDEIAKIERAPDRYRVKGNAVLDTETGALLFPGRVADLLSQLDRMQKLSGVVDCLMSGATKEE